MSAPESVVTVKARAYPSGTSGRALCNAGNYHFVSDEPSFLGGPGEAPNAGEFFLSGLVACGVGMLEMLANFGSLQ
jgi:uncharacterized OsmC-like protein